MCPARPAANTCGEPRFLLAAVRPKRLSAVTAEEITAFFPHQRVNSHAFLG